MFRTLFRRGIPVLILALALAGAAPAAAAEPLLLDRWEGLWGWVVSVWWDGATGDDDRGLGLDPDGLTSGGNRGPELDPNGTDDDDDRGAAADPNG